MKHIYIQPLGNLDKEIIQYLENNLSQKFSLSIRLLKAMAVPVEAYNLKRRQYLAPDLLKNVLKASPSDTLKILGVTKADIFIPIFTYVFGQAQLNGKAALISLHRLNPEYYGALPNQELYKTRAVKEAMHELGHTFGLIHCPEEISCIMSFSNSINEIDKKRRFFCPACGEFLGRKIEEIKKSETLL